MDREFLNKVVANLKHAEYALGEDDEQELNMAAYHIQQAFEIGIKQIYKEYGVPYSRIHNISTLLSRLPPNQEIISDEMIIEIGLLEPSLTEWKVSSRYTEGYLPVRQVLVKAFDLAQKFNVALHEGISSLNRRSGGVSLRSLNLLL